MLKKREKERITEVQYSESRVWRVEDEALSCVRCWLWDTQQGAFMGETATICSLIAFNYRTIPYRTILTVETIQFAGSDFCCWCCGPGNKSKVKWTRFPSRAFVSRANNSTLPCNTVFSDFCPNLIMKIIIMTLVSPNPSCAM